MSARGIPAQLRALTERCARLCPGGDQSGLFEPPNGCFLNDSTVLLVVIG